MVGASGTSLLDRATSAADLAQANPATAMRLAEAVLGSTGLDPETRATALWAVGLAARELDALDLAREKLADALAVAERADLVARAARIRLSLSLVLVYQGMTQPALAEMATARPHLRGAEAGWCDLQHALVMTRLGRLDEALEDSLRALPLLRAAGDRLAEARLLSNLGALRVYRGEFAEAEVELEAALALADELGQSLLRARTLHNLAFLDGRRADIPRSLARYEEGEAGYRSLDDPDPHIAVLEADRAEVLLAAGLSDEARKRAEASLAALERSQNLTDRAEVLLLVARCRLAADDRAGAAEAAAAAATSFAKQGRNSWVALAEQVALEVASFAHSQADGQLAEEVADRLAAAGWRLEEQRARLLAGRAHLAAGDVDQALSMLDIASARRRRGTAAERTAAWHAAALACVARGHRGGARRAVAAGLRVIEDHRTTLGATELRAHASAGGVALAEIGLRLAMEDARPREVLRWVESLRAVSVLTPPARPPDDAELADELGRLRVAEASRRSAPSPGVAAIQTARVRNLEASIARRTRRLRGGGAVERFDLDGLFDLLGDRVLLEFAVLDGHLVGLTVARGRVGMRHLGDLRQVEREAASALFCLRRLASDRTSEASLAAAAETLTHALAALDHLLLEQCRGVLADRPAVIVPAGPIRRVPWGALASMIGRPTSVAPSAAAWARAARVAPPSGPALLVAGPDLPGAEAEIADLATLRPDAHVLRPPASTCGAVLANLGRGVAHVAAHGTFRSDNPLFSSLLLSDGPLTVHDLSGVRSISPWVVLSACDAAVNAAPGGDEILGLGGVLLALGVANLVAPVTPVSDRASRPLMVRLHRRLLAGATPPEALALLSDEAAADDPVERATLAGFTAIGA